MVAFSVVDTLIFINIDVEINKLLVTGFENASGIILRSFCLFFFLEERAHLSGWKITDFVLENSKLKIYNQVF